MPVCARSRTMPRMPAPDGVAPGSNVARDTSPSLVSHSCSRRTWVDFPAPSPPSKAMSTPPPASRRRAVVSRRRAVTTSASSGTGPAVVHLPVGQDAHADGQQPGDEQHDPLAGEREGERTDVDLVLPDQAHAERHEGQRQDQRGPDQGLDDGEGAAADLVGDLGAQQREAGQVGDAGEEAHEDDEQQRDPERERPGHEQHDGAGPDDRDAEDPLAGEVAGHARADRDAQPEPDEDRAEQQAVGGVAAAERGREGLTGGDDHARPRRRPR